MRLLLTIFIFLASINAQAALYKYTDENGEVVYSDEPPYEGAEELVPPPLQTTPAFKTKPKTKPEAKPEEQQQATEYTSFKITRPKNEETLRDNITIQLAVEPKLNTKAGHYINIFDNGKTILKNSTSLTTTLKYIDRGIHNIKAEIRNKSGELIKSSNTVTIYIVGKRLTF